MRRNSFQKLLTLAAVAMAMFAFATTSADADLIGQLGILDLTANGGINPATGSSWQLGDQYRFAFVSSATRDATSVNIDDYNQFVQNLADASPLNIGAAQGATWKVIASTETVNARVNTSTDSGTGEAIFLLDGVTKVADNYGDLWDGLDPNLNEVIDLDENGAFLDTFVFAGTTPSGATVANRWLGTTIPSKGNPPTQIVVERGDTTPNTTGRWIQQYNDSPTTNRSFYALSDPLTVMEAGGGGPVAIAGTDFSDTPEFNAPGGQANLDNFNIDDLNPSDNITVTNWAFAGGGAFEGWDGNAQVGMPNSPVTKLNGSGGHAQPNVGDDPPTFNEASFSIDIPDDTILDLTTVTWDWRAATSSGNQRWLAFRTSLDDTLIFSEVGLARNAVDNQIITLDDPKYKNLTDQTVSFYWYASGEGTGDIDIDTIIVNGEVRGGAAVPEPSSFALAALGLLGLGWYGRRRRRLP